MLGNKRACEYSRCAGVIVCRVETQISDVALNQRSRAMNARPDIVFAQASQREIVSVEVNVTAVISCVVPSTDGVKGQVRVQPKRQSYNSVVGPVRYAAGQSNQVAAQGIIVTRDRDGVKG